MATENKRLRSESDSYLRSVNDLEMRARKDVDVVIREALGGRPPATDLHPSTHPPPELSQLPFRAVEIL